jgi:hypothetical protein
VTAINNAIEAMNKMICPSEAIISAVASSDSQIVCGVIVSVGSRPLTVFLKAFSRGFALPLFYKRCPLEYYTDLHTVVETPQYIKASE